jgi:hypothetical protein
MTKSIASIDFIAHHAERPKYGGIFDIPAVPKGAKPFLLAVPDHTEMEKQPHIVGGHQIPRQILGEEIAACVVNEWAANGLGMSPECGPGIWVVRDTIPLTNEHGELQVDPFTKRALHRPATDEEKAAMWAEDLAFNIARQERWGEYLIGQGDVLDADPNKKMAILISPAMRAAATYYGRSVKWLDRKIRANDRKQCPFCLTDIPSAMVKCSSCGEVVDRQRYAELTGKAPMTPPLKPTGNKEQPAA